MGRDRQLQPRPGRAAQRLTVLLLLLHPLRSVGQAHLPALVPLPLDVDGEEQELFQARVEVVAAGLAGGNPLANASRLLPPGLGQQLGDAGAGHVVRLKKGDEVAVQAAELAGVLAARPELGAELGRNQLPAGDAVQRGAALAGDGTRASRLEGIATVGGDLQGAGLAATDSKVVGYRIFGHGFLHLALKAPTILQRRYLIVNTFLSEAALACRPTAD